MRVQPTKPRYVSLIRTSSIASYNFEPAPNTPLWLNSKMVFGDVDGTEDGGRYGAVGCSSEEAPSQSVGCAMRNVSHHKHSSSTSSSSSQTSTLADDAEDASYMTPELYQRQPLLNGQPALANSDGLYQKNHNSSYYNGNALSGAIKINMPSPHRDEPRFPKEKMKTLLGFLFLLSNWIFTTASLAMTHEKVPSAPPLPDVVLDNINTQTWGLKGSEIIIIISAYFCVVVVFFHKHRFIIFRRLFLILGLLYFYRSITMYVTVLPLADANYYCSPKENTTNVVIVLKRVVQLLSGFGLSINGQHTFCGDYIYSGHTVCLVLAYLVVKEYTPRRWWPLHWMFALLAFLGIGMVLLARGHYTVDVLIAYYITTRLFYVYHTLANNETLKVHGPTNYFVRLWWFRIFQYFEKNVHGVVPRHYEWPLPWPRRWGTKNPQRTS